MRITALSFPFSSWTLLCLLIKSIPSSTCIHVCFKHMRVRTRMCYVCPFRTCTYAKLTAPLVARNMSAAGAGEGAERARAGRIPQDVQQQAREKESPVVSELLLAARRGRSEQVADLLRQSPSQAAVVDKVCYFQYTVRVRVRGPRQYWD